ncbi:hypothetical protein TSUD_269390 [Trifolium subterraneum]|uniref:DUF659 domain-containing protein n=1 Tax=Trifolium subterraneum TaxID=3900 RepID=A0A2Z6MZJ5_TRISU|nr:hypothetical protein TSUD_269390 [Trifolium subterraneum]
MSSQRNNNTGVENSTTNSDTRLTNQFTSGSGSTGSDKPLKAYVIVVEQRRIAICPKVTNEYEAEMTELETIAIEKAKRVQVPFPNGTTSLNPPIDMSKRRRGSDGPLAKAFNNEARDHLSAEIARLFYTAGLPFNVAKNPHFISAFTYAANASISGYVPPNYNFIRTTMFQREKNNVEKLLQPIKGTWYEKGVSIVSDGWIDAQKRPLINFMAISNATPMFLNAIDGTTEFKDKHYIAKLILETISVVGAQNVVQIITDNALVCKAAGSIVEEPIYDMLRSCDTNESNLHLVYEKWDSMIEQVKWTKSHTPLHCLAHSLNPRYYCRQWLDQSPNRVAPHRDNEICTERKHCLRNYFADAHERLEATTEFVKFSSAEGELGQFDSLQDRWNLTPKEWWITYGSSVPKLQSIALKLLSQPSSSSCAERN